jgi:hypothetical protein
LRHPARDNNRLPTRLLPVADCLLLATRAPTTAPTDDDDNALKGIINKIFGKFKDVIMAIFSAIFEHIDGSVKFWSGRS